VGCPWPAHDTRKDTGEPAGQHAHVPPQDRPEADLWPLWPEKEARRASYLPLQHRDQPRPKTYGCIMVTVRPPDNSQPSHGMRVRIKVGDASSETTRTSIIKVGSDKRRGCTDRSKDTRTQHYRRRTVRCAREYAGRAGASEDRRDRFARHAQAMDPGRLQTGIAARERSSRALPRL
jgi:hypothetical protein